MRELSLHILDVLENALEAGATEVELRIEEDLGADQLTITVRDNGRGMDAQTARRALDPFFTTRTTRHVGLGLPLFAAAAERCAGDLTLRSAPGQGTIVTAAFRHSHLDRAPLGDLTGTLLAFLLSGRSEPAKERHSRRFGVESSGNPGRPLRLIYHHRLDGRAFDLDTAVIRAELGEVPLSHPAVREWLHDYIAAGEADLVSTQQGVAIETS